MCYMWVFDFSCCCKVTWNSNATEVNIYQAHIVEGLGFTILKRVLCSVGYKVYFRKNVASFFNQRSTHEYIQRNRGR